MSIKRHFTVLTRNGMSLINTRNTTDSCTYSVHAGSENYSTLLSVLPALVWSSDGFTMIDCSVVEFDSLFGTTYVNQLMIKLFNLQLQITLSQRTCILLLNTR